MKHHRATRKFGRVRKTRTGLLRSLAVSLIVYGKIETTEAKAKELRPFIEKLVTAALKNTIASRRLVSARLGNSKTAAKKLTDTIAPPYKTRPGGYTRITKIGTDVAGRPKAVIEFLEK